MPVEIDSPRDEAVKLLQDPKVQAAIKPEELIARAHAHAVLAAADAIDYMTEAMKNEGEPRRWKR